MVACPRCGNDAEYLPDEVWTLISCEFCGESLDAADLMLGAALDRMAQTPPAPSEELAPAPLHTVGGATLTPRSHWGQIARASYANATATRSLTGSSTATS